MRLTHGLRVISIATIVAFGGVSALSAPIVAVESIPTPITVVAPAAPLPATTPTPTPAPTPAAIPPTAVVPAPATVLASVRTPIAVPPAKVVAPAAAKPNLGAKVVRIAMAQRNKRYVRGAMGPRAFDCSGLVRYAYRLAGVTRKLGGGHSARAMYLWARLHHLTSRTNPRVGDVVIYGGGTHAAIYIGRGLVISALNPRKGIRITRLRALTSPFTAYIHTRI